MEAPWRLLQPEGAQAGAHAVQAAVDFDSLLWQLPATAGELDFLMAPDAPLLGGGHSGEAAARGALGGGEVAVPRSEQMIGGRQATPAAEESQAGARTPSDEPGAKRPRSSTHSASPASSEQPQQQLPPPPGELSVLELLARDVSPAMCSLIGRLHVPAMVFAARAEPLAPLATCNVSSMRAMMQASAGREAVEAQAAALRSCCAALRASGDVDSPAWLLGAAAPPHAESALLNLQQHAQALSATFADSTSPTRGYVAVLKRPLSAPERAHVSDIAHLLGALHAFLSSAQSLLAQLRCRRGGASDYLDASAGVLDLIAAMMRATHDTNAARIAEFGERVGAQTVWPSPYLEHAAAAGCTFT